MINPNWPRRFSMLLVTVLSSLMLADNVARKYPPLNIVAPFMLYVLPVFLFVMLLDSLINAHARMKTGLVPLHRRAIALAIGVGIIGFIGFFCNVMFLHILSVVASR